MRVTNISPAFGGYVFKTGQDHHHHPVVTGGLVNGKFLGRPVQDNEVLVIRPVHPKEHHAVSHQGNRVAYRFDSIRLPELARVTDRVRQSGGFSDTKPAVITPSDRDTLRNVLTPVVPKLLAGVTAHESQKPAHLSLDEAFFGRPAKRPADLFLNTLA